MFPVSNTHVALQLASLTQIIWHVNQCLLASKEVGCESVAVIGCSSPRGALVQKDCICVCVMKMPVATDQLTEQTGLCTLCCVKCLHKCQILILIIRLIFSKSKQTLANNYVSTRDPGLQVKNRQTLWNTHNCAYVSAARGSAAAGLVDCHPTPSILQPILDPQHIPIWSHHHGVKYYLSIILAMQLHQTYSSGTGQCVHLSVHDTSWKGSFKKHTTLTMSQKGNVCLHTHTHTLSLHTPLTLTLLDCIALGWGVGGGGCGGS